MLLASAPGGALDPETMTLKLGDFGLVTKVEHSRTATRNTGTGAGTPKYMAHETLVRGSTSTLFASDVWSLGVSLTELASLHTPPGESGLRCIVGFRPENVPPYLDRLEEWEPEDRGFVHEGVCEDIAAMLEFEVESRPTCDALLARRRVVRSNTEDSEQSIQAYRELVRECGWSLYDILNRDERCRAVIDDARGWRDESSGAGNATTDRVKTWRTGDEDILRQVRAFVDAGAPSSTKLWRHFDMHAVTLAHCRRREIGFLVRGCRFHFRFFPFRSSDQVLVSDVSDAHTTHPPTRSFFL